MLVALMLLLALRRIKVIASVLSSCCSLDACPQCFTLSTVKRYTSSTSYLRPDSLPELDSLTEQSEGRGGGEDEQRRGESGVELSGAEQEQSGTERRPRGLKTSQI